MIRLKSFFKPLPKKITEETVLWCRVKYSICLPAGAWEEQPFPGKLTLCSALASWYKAHLHTQRLSQESHQPSIPIWKKHLQLHKTCYGMLRGGTKDKKREGDDNRDGWLVSQFLVLRLPSSVLHLISTICPVFPWNSISNSPRVRGLSPLCAHVFGVSTAGAGDYSSWRAKHLGCQRLRGLGIGEMKW